MRDDERDDERDHEREDEREDNPAEQAKADPPTRPDRPSPSDEATLVQRGEGAHDEFADAPLSMEDPSRRDAKARRQQEERRGDANAAPDERSDQEHPPTG